MWDSGVKDEGVGGRVSNVVSGIEKGLVMPWSYSSDDVDLLLSHCDLGGDVGTSSLAAVPVVNGTLSDTVYNTLFGGEISRIFEVPFVEEDFGPLFDSCREVEVVGRLPMRGELEGAGEKKNSVADVMFSEHDMQHAEEVVESKRLSMGHGSRRRRVREREQWWLERSNGVAEVCGGLSEPQGAYR